MSDTKRLFLALPIDNRFKELISKFIRLQQIPAIKWIPPENWHVTVLFLGDFPERHIQQLILSLNEFFASQRPNFSLEFDKFIYIPKQIKPTMIWAKFYQNSYFDQLCLQLADHLEKLYAGLSVPFRLSLHAENVPHATLCRLKNQYLTFPDFYIRDLNTTRQLLRCDFCTLYQSDLTTEGAKYSKLADFKLTEI